MKTKRKQLHIFIMFLAISALIFSGCANNPNTEATENNEADKEPTLVKITDEPMDEATEEPTSEITEEPMSETSDEIMLTLEELKEFDGKDGAKAYVAYEGVIYDVTGVAQWKSGSHGGNMAGTDITEMLNSAPHGVSKLDNLTIVGKIVE